MIVSMLDGTLLVVVAFVHMRMCMDHAPVNMRMSVILSPEPAQKQARRQKYDDQPNRHLGALKDSGGKLTREQQQGNSEGEQCGCVPGSPGQAEYAGTAATITTLRKHDGRDGRQVVRICCVPKTQEYGR
jgi:hypothetical protein